jgi:hypothetical protein
MTESPEKNIKSMEKYGKINKNNSGTYVQSRDVEEPVLDGFGWLL